MGYFEILGQLSLVIAIGFLIGLEREFAHKNSKTHFAGARTFVLSCLCGFLTALLAKHFHPLIFVISFASLSALTCIAYIFSSRQGDLGATTEISLILTFLLGALIFFDYVRLAITCAVIITGLLSLKFHFKSLVFKLTEEDIRAILKFIIVTAIITPFLPDRTIDPYNIINPKDTWIIVILALSISFFGYILVKFWHAEKGIVLTGFLGGLVSSTAVSWIFSKKSNEDPENLYSYVTAVVLAITVMFARVLILAYLINKSLAIYLLLPMTFLCLGGLLTSYFLYNKTSKQVTTKHTSEKVIGNPFNLSDAIKFALIYSAILILIKILQDKFGEAGIYIASAFAGITDLDAITVSLSKLSLSELSIKVAGTAVLISLVTNNSVKFLIAIYRGSHDFRKIILIPFSILVIGSGAALWAYS